MTKLYNIIRFHSSDSASHILEIGITSKKAAVKRIHELAKADAKASSCATKTQTVGTKKDFVSVCFYQAHSNKAYYTISYWIEKA